MPPSVEPDAPSRAADELLVVRCQLGEPDAFDALIARWHHPSSGGAPLPSPVVAELQTELSRGGRVGHVMLALIASAMTVVVVSLWLTEPRLPLRTHIAFATLTAIGAARTVFSMWFCGQSG